MGGGRLQFHALGAASGLGNLALGGFPPRQNGILVNSESLMFRTTYEFSSRGN